MDPKDKALKTALTGIAVLAVAMVGYYWISWKTHRSENDVSVTEKAEVQKDEKGSSEFAGVYSSTEAVEGNNHRLAFFSLNKKEDGSGYFGTAKVDPIGSDTEAAVFMSCNDVSIGDKDFFVKCNDPMLGQISFSGEWSKPNGTVQVSGKLLWSKDGAEIANKSTTLNRTGS